MVRGYKTINYVRLNLVSSQECGPEIDPEGTALLPEKTEDQNMKVDLETALDLVGVGKYQICHCALMVSALVSAIMEIIGNAFILPAASCNFELPATLHGIVISIPGIGIILTAALWGRAADHWGRKPALTVACAGAGSFGILAAFMPEAISFAACKLAGSLFLACPSSISFAFAGEMITRRRRDLSVLICNGCLSILAVLTPLLAWLILIHEWHVNIFITTLYPWRLLTMVYATPLLITAAFMTQSKESPKFLITKEKFPEALEVLKYVFVKNTGLPAEEYPVTSLKRRRSFSHRPLVEEESDTEIPPQATSESLLALFKPPHLKWIALIGFLMFGVFALLNGLFLFSFPTINAVVKEKHGINDTLCLVLNARMKHSSERSHGCERKMSHTSFAIMASSTLISGFIVLAASLAPVSKRALLCGMFSVTALACLLANVVHDMKVAAVSMAALQLTSLGVGPLTAYVVMLFPTTLRGTAMGAVLMFGRIGSVVGSNSAGYFLVIACRGAFITFTLLLVLCAMLSLLLPKGRVTSPVTEDIQQNR